MNDFFLTGGLVLPFTPRGTWTKFLDPQTPQSFSSHSRQKRDSIQQVRSGDKSQQIFPFHGKPYVLPQVPLALPTPDTPAPDSRKHNAGSIAQITAVDVDSGRPPPTMTDEIQGEGPSPRFGRQHSRTQWGSCISAGEERRSRDEATEELKVLRELAKASFSRSRKESDGIGSPAGHVRGSLGSLLQIHSSPSAVSLRDADQNRYARRRQLFGMMPQRPRSDAESISQATSDADSIFLQEDGPVSSTVPPVMSSSNSGRSNVSKGPAPGHVESTGHSVSLRDHTSGAIRPLEDR